MTNPEILSENQNKKTKLNNIDKFFLFVEVV